MSHGGDIYNNHVDIDLSVSLNPYSTPELKVLIDEALREGIAGSGVYPDMEQTAVRKALAKADSVSHDCVFAGNGSSELIMAIARSVAPKRALLIEPCFSGYRYALESAGCGQIREYYLKEKDGFALTEEVIDSITGDIDIMFLCDPWNPTGQNIKESTLEKILIKAYEAGVAVVLDESFYMLSDKYIKCTHENMQKMCDKFTKLFIVRSYTKCFSIPGIRMGYVISGADNVISMRRALPEWNLSSISSALMRRLSEYSADGSFFHRSVEMIAGLRSDLAEKLTGSGAKVYKSDTNFILFQGEECTYEKYFNKGILIRKCDDFRGLNNTYFRISVKRDGSF